MANAATKPAPAEKKRVERTQDEKRKNFLGAAPSRVDRILKAVTSLRAVAKPVKYLWTDGERQEIFKTLAQAVTDCEASFRSPGTAKGTGFTFSGKA